MNIRELEKITSHINNVFSFIEVEVASTEPNVIKVKTFDNINLMAGYVNKDDNSTVYEKVENILVVVIDEIREVFDIDCDYTIGAENSVEIILL